MIIAVEFSEFRHPQTGLSRRFHILHGMGGGRWYPKGMQVGAWYGEGFLFSHTKTYPGRVLYPVLPES